MPEWTRLLRERLGALGLPPAREAEIVDELSQHLDQRYEDLRGGGATDDEARARALEELLDLDALAAGLRELRRARVPAAIQPGEPRRSLLADAAQDARLAVRRLAQQPWFAAAAILTVALGLGANSAMFALTDAALLRPLPFPEPGRLVALAERTADSERAGVSPLNLTDWAARSRTLESLGGFVPSIGSMVLAGADGSAETVARQWVTAGFFEVLGVAPLAGRVFQPDDDRQRARVAVLSEPFWRSRFRADPAVVGREIALDGKPFTVVGVVPERAQVFGRTAIWALNPILGAPARARGAHPFLAIGRLRPGTTLEAARADLTALAAALATEFPDTNAGRSVTVEPLHDAVIGGDLRRTALLFLGVVGVVLLLACANVASLLLVRSTQRLRELGIRCALGADRARLVRQLLTENLVLAALGGVAGLALGAVLLRAAPALVPDGVLPPAVGLALDLRVVAFCAAATFAAGLLFGVAPAWHASRFPPARALAHDGRTTTGSGGRLRAALVAGELATALALLFGASLLLRTLLAVEGVDRGYHAGEVLSLTVDPLGSRYPTDEALLRFYDDVEREVRAAPGVRDLAWATTLPLGPSEAGSYAFEVVGEAPGPGAWPTADYQIVSPAYFRTMGVPIVAGRALDERDRKGTEPVAIVNEAFVRRYLGNRPAIGTRLALRPSDEAGAPVVVREVVGVARQVRGRPDETEEFVQVYVPLAQEATGDIYLLVRPASGRAAALSSVVRAAIGRVDKDRLVSLRNAATLDEVAARATARHRFRAVLVAGFAGLALVLAMVGLFGAVASTVQQRRREFGIRRALGADTAAVLRSLMGGAAHLLAVGTLAGGVLSLALGRLLDNLLYGVSGLDPTSFALALMALGSTVVAALAGPAWRAVRVDPAVALRVD